jgi:hypothetical protein
MNIMDINNIDISEWIGKIICDFSCQFYRDDYTRVLVAVFVKIDSKSYKISCSGETSSLNIIFENVPNDFIDIGGSAYLSLIECDKNEIDVKNKVINHINFITDEISEIGLCLSLSDLSLLHIVNWGDNLLLSKLMPGHLNMGRSI